MINKLNIFILLMWKNWTLIKRSPIITLYELIFPIILCLGFIRYFRWRVAEVHAQEFDAFYVDYHNILCSNTSIAVAPKGKIVDRVLDRILKDCPKINFTHYKNSQQLNEAILSNNFYAAIQFDDTLKSITKNTDLPSNLKITIRIKSDDSDGKREWFTHLLYPLISSPGPRNSDAKGGEPEYQNRGFLLLQQLITLAIVNHNKSVEPHIMMRKYPYPSSVNDKSYKDDLGVILPVGIIITFATTYSQLLTAIATEKEQQLKESMKVMGLPLWLNWLAWFVRGFVFLFIITSVTVLLLTINIIRKPFFPKTDGTLLFIFLTLFACSVISSTFLTSVFFSNATVAATVGSIAFIFSDFPYFIIKADYFSTALGVKLGVSLLANSAMCFGVLVIARFESFGEGAQWSNLWDHVTPDDNLTLGYVMMMLIFDTFLYFMVALYVDAIYPGEFGIPKPWYFPILFVFSCWRCNTFNRGNETASSNEGELFEKITENLPKGIQLKNVSKSFGRRKVVKNLSLDIYEGHITVLLGHNGAGKTTTMSMITGMCPPSTGTVIVNGHDVRRNIDGVRHSMGLCLQHNVLFDALTVEEHLYFFCKLKGLRGQQLRAEINEHLILMGLKSKKNEKIALLSGGIKRKLSVAIALCGNPKVVLLDEPTSGMDAFGREVVQSLIRTLKRGRTILLTTHSMDEADLLGDRIAIMTAGELQCCGSSFFLKKKLAAGYYLIMVVSPNCVPKSVTSLLKIYIPQVKLYSHVGTELTYHLPQSESEQFESALEELESKSEELGILSYGISFATLDQVFMKVGVDRSKITKSQEQDSLEERSKINYATEYRLLLNQFFGMLLKKFLSTFRNWTSVALQIILAVFVLLFFLVNLESPSGKNDSPALEITMDSYSNPVTLFSGDKKNPLFASYKNVVTRHGKLLEVTDISETILAKIKASPRLAKISYIVGISFEKNLITAWFNGNPYHSAPLALGLVLDSLYKYHLGDEKSVSFVNHPLPFDLKVQLKEFNTRGFMLFMALGYSISLVVCFYTIFYVKERVCNSRHLQYTSGANVFVFWVAAFLTDLIIYIMSLIPIIITLAALKIEGFKTPEEIGRLTLVLIAFGFFVLPFLHLVSNLISNPVHGFVIILMFAVVSGVIGVLVVYAFQVRQLLETAVLALNWILMLTPFYTFCKAVLDINLIHSVTTGCSENVSPEESCKILNKTVCCDIRDYFSLKPPGIGANILISFIIFFLLITVLITYEFGYFNDIKSTEYIPPKLVTDVNDDVQEEIDKIKTTSKNVLDKLYCLVLHDVTKYYKKNSVVNGLCLAVKPFECFGLLGANGTGKTTTFKMLTGEIEMSYGEAWIKGMSIKTELKKIQKSIGYCPQSDALLEDLTVRDTLKIFALIRGIPCEKCTEVGEELAHELDFFKYIDKQIKHLSGGTKRKVSTAVAVIGEPSLIFLDEPTTGMDPASKRHAWKYFCKLRDRGMCIILTSHSMEECEALCTRVGIIVNGNFQCLGSVQHLKNKFAKGYLLTVKANKAENIPLYESVAAIESFVKQHFSRAKIKEKYQELLTFQLPSSTLSWSQIFGLLERHKKELNIEDYSVGQCSLNQVFLSFTKHQKQEQEEIEESLSWWQRC